MDTTREQDDSRRSFLKKAAYTAPLILTLKADPAFASYGSGKPVDEKPVKTEKPWKEEKPGKDKGAKGNNGVGNGPDPQPPGNPRVNDGPDTGPGNPGNKRNK
jgi:hypothetical protein